MSSPTTSLWTRGGLNDRAQDRFCGLGVRLGRKYFVCFSVGFPGARSVATVVRCTTRLELNPTVENETGGNSGPDTVQYVMDRGDGGRVGHCQVNHTLTHSVGIILVYIFVSHMPLQVQQLLSSK